MATYDDSFLTRALADFREAVDEPAINAKYTDARAIRKIEDAYSLVITDINRISVNPVVATYTVTVTDSQLVYTLPASLQSVTAIYCETSAGYRLFYSSRSRWNPAGRYVWTEGRHLHVQSGVFSAGAEIKVEYIPLCPRLFNSEFTSDSTEKVITISSAANAGTIDTRHNAYAGCIFRVLSAAEASYNYVQEHQVASHTPTTGTYGALALSTALSPACNGAGDKLYCEIVPPIPILLDQVVPLFAAYHTALREGATVRSRLLRGAYMDAARSVQLTEFYSNIQEAARARHDNFFNSRYRRRAWRI